MHSGRSREHHYGEFLYTFKKVVLTSGNVRVWFACTEENGIPRIHVHVIQYERTEYPDVARELAVESEDQLDQILVLSFVRGTGLVSGDEIAELVLVGSFVGRHQRRE